MIKSKSRKSGSFLRAFVVISCTALMFIWPAAADETDAADDLNQGAVSVSDTLSEVKSGRVSLDVARDRAKLLHQVYASTLDVMHDRYFHGDRATVPARAMDDVFSEIRRQQQIDARWIAVTLRAMNIDNDPETEFEKHAARAIKSGQSELEEVDLGVYHRAVAIPLKGGCVNCHSGSLGQSTRKHFAGLVISIPINNVNDTPAPNK